MILEYKQPGLTMNQVIEYNKIKYNATKMCYCGRLDPMARGKIILLKDKDCKDMTKYNKLNKIYEFEIILGIKTSSDDPLGLIEELDTNILSFIEFNKIYISILRELYNYPIEIKQKYHKYSSKNVNGKPLWYYAKNNLFIEQPTHNVSIFSINTNNFKFYNFDIWKTNIINNINTIDNTCDFNQNNTINQWNNINMNELISIPVRINVSSGFYVRQFVRDLSDKINYPLLTYDINRISFNI
jgi:tRNA pseudouridine(55) synthase